MPNETLAGVAKAEVIERVVIRSIASRTWRNECLKDCLGYAAKTERKAVEAYVLAQYNAAGAGFSGRW